MATGALVPAESGIFSRIAPVAVLSAYRSPWNVVVNTTLLVTVAAPYGEDGSLVSHSIFPVSWLTATISPVALKTAWMVAAADPEGRPVAFIGSGRSLTAAKVVEPLLASWVSMPPIRPGSMQTSAGSPRCEVGLAYSVSSPSLFCQEWTPTGSFQ